MKTTQHLALIVLFILTFSSCNKNKEEDEVNNRTPGYFVLAELNNKNSSLESAKSVAASNFDFGDLKASKEFFFLLVNGGNEPIFNITLSTDNSQFDVNPSQVPELSGGTIISNAENTGIIPILTLGITHGTNLNGVGFDDLLPMGVNSCVLTITGQTLDNGDTVDISSSFDFSVNAKVMDIELFKDGDIIDIENPTGSVFATALANLGGLGSLRYYSAWDTSAISIKNTGNVGIDVYYGDESNQDNFVSIQESDSVSIDMPNFITVIVLDSKGTITENNRIQLGNDGKGYLSVIKNNQPQ